METKEVTTWRDDTALWRFQIIAPLLDPALDRDKKIQMRKDLAARNDLSEKTLRRYESSYQEKGFAGLKPAERVRRASPDSEHFQNLMEEAILLKREVPSRSVCQIIYILESEGKAEPGFLKRSTVAFCGAQRTLMRFRADAMRYITDAPKRSMLLFNLLA